MAVVVSDAGEVVLLRNAVYGTGTPARNWTIHLFQNNHTPAASDTSAGTYTEADFTGYASQAVAGWSNPTTVANKGKTIAGTNTFTVGSTPTTTNTVYGYYVTDDDNGGALLWAEKFASPTTMSLAGQTLAVIPALTLETA